MERVFNEKRLSNRDNLILTCFSVYCFVGILLLSVLTKISIVEKDLCKNRLEDDKSHH